MKKLKVSAVSLKGILGIKEMSLECGQITTIAGGNGSGKTSLLDGLKAGLGGGNLARLKKVGTEEDPEVVLVIDDGAYRVERKGAETVVKQRVGQTAAYEEVRKPQTFLDGLFDQVLCNPLAFLNAHPSDRTDMLLEVLPLTLDVGNVMTALADCWPADRVVPSGHPLQVLTAMHSILFDERTGVNRSAKDKASSFYELRKELPADMPEDIGLELKSVSEARDRLFQALAGKRAEAEVAEQQAVAAAQAVFDQTEERVLGTFKAAAQKVRTAEAERIGTITTELEREIAALRARADQAIATVKEETATAIAAEKKDGEFLLAKAGDALQRALETASEVRKKASLVADAIEPDLDALRQRVAELTAQDKDAESLRGRKALADRFEKEANDLKAVSDALTKGLEKVEVFKTSLLADLPIDGLEIHGKEIRVHGVLFDQLNTGQRIHIAVQLAAIRAKTMALPVLFVDGAEALERKEFDLLIGELEATGVQAFVAKVAAEGGDLEVTIRDGVDFTLPVVKNPRAEKATPTRRGRTTLVE